MDSKKVSFAINDKEGLSELRRRQDEAGASSLGLYVKQLVREHLAHDGDEAMARLTESVEQLRATVMQLAKRQTDMLRHQIDEQAAPDLQIDDLRKCLQVMFVALLQCPKPVSAEVAEKIVRKALGENQ